MGLNNSTSTPDLSDSKVSAGIYGANFLPSGGRYGVWESEKNSKKKKNKNKRERERERR